MTRVKICGINDPVGFDTAVEAGADWVGFVFFPRSPRFVTPVAAASLAGRFAGGPPRVGLFVQPTQDVIAEVLDHLKLDILQIYGVVEELPAIKARFGLPVWRACGISTPADRPDDSGGADGLVLEAKPPAGSDRPGGNATTFEWSILNGWRAPVPWLLAGGLTPDNVVTAIRETGATAVDVSSGVERAKGVKDPELIRAFVNAARASGHADRDCRHGPAA
jgi:phosphoribosylanthranilate isomerase